jgi:CO/xanthine dehydrogenase Mo-binding subunit
MLTQARRPRPRTWHGVRTVGGTEAYAAVVDVDVDVDARTARVTRALSHTIAVIVNPDGLRSQIEGNVVQGIGRTLKESVTFDRSRVTTSTGGHTRSSPSRYPSRSTSS